MRRKTIGIFVLAVSVTMAMPLSAKDGREKDKREEYRGIIKSRPADSLQGEWVIGERTFKTDANTEFDESEGNLTVGSCAEVEIRNEKVHEIDSEPMEDCR
jgi:hypothetical protein